MESTSSIKSLYDEALNKLEDQIQSKKDKLQSENEKEALMIEKQELVAKMNLKILMIEDLKLEKENPDKAFLRKLRREKEFQTNKLVPPGPWDEDLDVYQDKEASIYLSNSPGYKAKIVRNDKNHSWDIVITVPEDHWIITNYPYAHSIYDRIEKDDFKWKMCTYHMQNYELGFNSGSTEENYIDMYNCMQIAFKIVDRLKKQDIVSEDKL